MRNPPMQARLDERKRWINPPYEPLSMYETLGSAAQAIATLLEWILVWPAYRLHRHLEGGTRLQSRVSWAVVRCDRGPLFSVASSSTPALPRSPPKCSELPKMEWVDAIVAESPTVAAMAEQRRAVGATEFHLAPGAAAGLRDPRPMLDRARR